ncbi:hypothetical protein ACN38_g6720 [Penicillium nordicum]|uniref:Uncharacterized protein n=1 Tax=Penicillium nordicum TaxID=229535 RepID=A0A0M8P020_9EURO|nr:hypothetical protein ACN38_g6720 [Penicillium nordicum]
MEASRVISLNLPFLGVEASHMCHILDNFNHSSHCPLTYVSYSKGICYGNSGIRIFCRQIFRHLKASKSLILVSDPWPGYTFVGRHYGTGLSVAGKLTGLPWPQFPAGPPPVWMGQL